MEQTDVVIIGAGPTGLVLAIELARRGISFKIFDKESSPQTLSRALLIQARTLEIFEEYEIVDTILKEAVHLNGSRFHTGKKVHDVDFIPLNSKYPYGVILPQAQTEKILTDKLHSFNHAIVWAKEFDSLTQNDSFVEVSFKDGTTIKTKYLIASDGAHSSVRHNLDLAFKGSSFDKTFALGDVAFDNDPLKDRIEAFLDTNFLILFPLPNKFVRVVVEDDNANKDKILTKEVLQKILIDSQCPYIIKEASWLSYFHINFRRVNKYKVGHVFLAGDAAHVHSPAGGLGMNTGIQDAYNLGWKLAFVIKNLAYEKILDTYEQERLPVAENVLNVTEKLTNVMVVRNKFLSFLRQLFLPFFKDCRSLKRVVLNHMAQLLVNYKQSPLSKGKLGGVKVDDKELFIVDKPKNHLFELTKSLKFVLLIHTKGHNDAFNKDLALKTEVLNRYSKQIDVFMVEGQLQEELILIRPDQYIALSCSLKSSNELFAYLNNLFITSE